jgi:hypothetical protein
VSAVDSPRDHTLAIYRACAAMLFAAWVAGVLALGARVADRHAPTFEERTVLAPSAIRLAGGAP